jgi:flagellar secretion chaperone FliS
MTRTDLAYRKTAAEAASGLGLLISLYDTLAGDLRRAAQAQRENNIESRSREVRHAFLVIGYLQDWINKGSGGQLADQLNALYASLRRNIVDAEAKQAPDALEKQMNRVLEIREQWQAIELRNEPSGPEVLRPEIPMPANYPQPDRLASRWSA